MTKKGVELHWTKETLAKDRQKEKVKINDSDFIWVRWPNGKHFYLKYKGMDVVVDGCEKWPTRESTLRAVERFKFYLQDKK